MYTERRLFMFMFVSMYVVVRCVRGATGTEGWMNDDDVVVVLSRRRRRRTIATTTDPTTTDGHGETTTI